MAAPNKNQYWKARRSHGRKPKFATPEEFYSKCVDYFEWVEASPLMKSVQVIYQGKATTYEVAKMRAMTLKGLCLYLGIRYETLLNYRKRPGFEYVTERVDSIIYEQKFSGAAAGLFNPVIIARELNLKGRQNQS